MKHIHEAIERERCYQEAKHGTNAEHPHTVGEWLLIMESVLAEAKQAWCRGGGDEKALEELLQVVTTGVSAMEQHGVVERTIMHVLTDPDRPVPFNMQLSDLAVRLRARFKARAAQNEAATP